MNDEIFDLRDCDIIKSALEIAQGERVEIIPLTGDIFPGPRDRACSRYEQVTYLGHIVAFDPHPYIRRGQYACGTNLWKAVDAAMNREPGTFIAYFSNDCGVWADLPTATHLTIIGR